MGLDVQPWAQIGLIVLYLNKSGHRGEAAGSLCHHLEDPHGFKGKYLCY